MPELGGHNALPLFQELLVKRKQVRQIAESRITNDHRFPRPTLKLSSGLLHVRRREWLERLRLALLATLENPQQERSEHYEGCSRKRKSNRATK